MKRVWIVSEGSPGHDSQSEGLASALAERVAVQTHRARARTRAPGLVRPALVAMMGARGRALPGALLRRAVDLELPEAAGADWVLASGGKSAIGARSMASRLGASLVFLGEVKRLPEGWFDVIVTPADVRATDRVVPTELIVTSVTPAGVARAAAGRERPEGILRAMVVGGSSRSHRYTDDDWRGLAAGMNAIAAREGGRWLLTTSRRTGARAEAVLRRELDPDALADAVWWSVAPRRELHAFLGLSDSVFVTQDSVTMVTEAVASGRPVVALAPRVVRLSSGSFLRGYFARRESRGRIRRARIGELGGMRVDPEGFSVLERPILDTVAPAVLERLAARGGARG